MPFSPCRLFVLLFVLTSAGHQLAFTQKVPGGFNAGLLYAVPEIKHTSVVTCDGAGNLIVGEDRMDMRGPTNGMSTKFLRRISTRNHAALRH
jgi:hypothetical protein